MSEATLREDTLRPSGAKLLRPPRISERQRALLSLLRNKGAVAAIVVLAFIVGAAVFANWVAPYNPVEVAVTESLVAPSARHWLGTDLYGRDTFSRVIYGARLSLLVALAVTAISWPIGLVAGMLAGFFGGRLDSIVMRLMDILLSFPTILLAMAIVGALGPGLLNSVLAIAVTWIPFYARLARGCTLSVRNAVYIEAARSIGCPSRRIVVRHVLPNIMAPLIVYATLRFGTAILSFAALGYLGLGAQPPTPEWGTMLRDAREFIRLAWWLTVFPGLAIVITVLSINLLGDGLRSALDPRLRLER